MQLDKLYLVNMMKYSTQMINTTNHKLSTHQKKTYKNYMFKISLLALCSIFSSAINAEIALNWDAGLRFTADSGTFMQEETAPSNDTFAATKTIKWNPGHYLAINNSYLDFSKTPAKGRATDIKGSNAFTGIKAFWTWSDLEPSEGVYDFSAIFAHLNEFRTWSPQPKLVIQIKERDFHTTTPKSMPAYVVEDGGYLIRDDDKRRVIPAAWRDAYKIPFKNLITAMSSAINPETGLTLNEDPLLEGIILSETALGMGGKLRADDLNTPDNPAESVYVNGLLETILHAKSLFPNTIIFQNANWLQGIPEYMQYFVDRLAENGIGISGPDFSGRVNSVTDAETAVKSGDYRGVIPIARDNQNSRMLKGILCRGKTVDDVYNYLINDPAGPKLTHVFWIRLNRIEYCENGWSWNNRLLPEDRRIWNVVHKNSSLINDAIPSALK